MTALLRVGPGGLLADSAGRPLLTTADACCCPPPDPDPEDTPGCSSVDCPLTVSVVATGFISVACVPSNVVDIGGTYTLTRTGAARKWEVLGSFPNTTMFHYIRLECETNRPELTPPDSEAWVLHFRAMFEPLLNATLHIWMEFGRLAFLEQGCPAIGPLPLIAGRFGLTDVTFDRCYDGTIEVLG